MNFNIPSPEAVSALLRRRRAVFPPVYTDEAIDRSIIETILEDANWAPTHRLTEPWRFQVFRGAARTRVADYLADYYQANTPEADFSEVRQQKMRFNPLHSDTIIAICMQRDAEARIPEWEEIAAVACAVQNMWLSCAAHGLGCYWSTPPAALAANAFLGLGEGERCLGFFYIGSYAGPAPEGKRRPIAEKTIWHEE